MVRPAAKKRQSGTNPARANRHPSELESELDTAPVNDAGWRRRVVDRSLESATKRSLGRSQTFIWAAIELLRERGTAFSLQEVSDRAGLSLRLFYQHFHGKDDLLLAVLEEEYRVITARHRNQLGDEPDPVRRLIRYLDVSLAVASEESPHNIALLKYEVELSISHPDEMAQAQAPQIDLAREIIAEGIASGAWCPSGAEEGAYVITALKRAYNRSKLAGNELGGAMPDVSELIRFCVEGLGGRMP